MSTTTRKSLRYAGLFTGVAVAAGLMIPALAATSSVAATGDTLAVDFSQTTGAFRGGASGTLYGFGDDGVPSQPVIDGAHVTNTSQKPPDGLQHPNGDALQIEKSFFEGGGKDLYVYVQDAYPDWPYNGGVRPGDANNDGVWDYLPILKDAVEKVATKSADPQDYIFIPFNEPDGGNWYPDWANQKTQFLADWTAAYQTIESVYVEHGLGHAKVGGPGDSAWHPDRSTDFLTYAKANNELPDIFIWHELGESNLASFRNNYASYRQVLQNVGLPLIPVNITEFGLLRDMGVPGQLIQWMSMFEDEKVDAETAYWNYAGNLSDNSSRNNGANGGWWMFNWYGSLAGSQTVRVTPPQLNVQDSLQGTAAIDISKKKATVLFGGGSNDVSVAVAGLPQDFGSIVDVQVRRDRLNGAEGASLQPPVVVSMSASVVDGKITVPVPNDDRYSAYQVEITPSLATRQPVATDLVNSTEAEAATIQNATVYDQSPTNGGFMASGGRDVGSFNQAGSSATWNVTVPRDGTYRLSVLGGANQNPGQHALFVDGTFNQLIRYSADLGWSYRGTTDVLLSLTAGTHALSVRASQDGSTVLPGADITLDRFDLYDVTDGESAVYPAVDADLSNNATVTYADQDVSGFASLSGSGEATLYGATADTGYYDVTVHFATPAAAVPELTINGRKTLLPGVSSGGRWASTMRVYLPQGINEVSVDAASGTVLLGDVSTLRNAADKAADANSDNVYTAEAASLPLAGTAVSETLPANSNGAINTAGNITDVQNIGAGSGNTIAIPRPSGFAAGQYQLVVSASNADKSAAINYNPQVISRFLDVSEAGGGSVRAAFRHNYSWISFWDKTVPLDLTTSNGSIMLGNDSTPGPNVATVTLAKYLSGAPVTVADGTSTPVPTPTPTAAPTPNPTATGAPAPTATAGGGSPTPSASALAGSVGAQSGSSGGSLAETGLKLITPIALGLLLLAGGGVGLIVYLRRRRTYPADEATRD